MGIKACGAGQVGLYHGRTCGPSMILRIIDDPSPRLDWITPEMIEVGALILCEYGGLGPYTAKHLAEDGYKAMAERAGSPKSRD